MQAGGEGARGGVAVEEEDGGVGLEGGGDVGVPVARGGEAGAGALVGVGEDEPGAEFLAVGGVEFEV